MKNKMTLICFLCVVSCYNLLNAQKNEKTSAIYDYTERTLNNTDTIPDFDSKVNKLKITGTIYKKDGKTPAQDVILYICQPDENGDYEMRKDSKRKRYVHHRAWIKTDADGRYTFYTFIPGDNNYVKELKQIQRIVKVPGQSEQELNSFFFNDDPLLPDLTLECRALVVQSMLRLEKKDGMFLANRDFKVDIKVPNIQ
jgi:protocatechuate 3,4-dioxygenase beta subunit